MDKKQVVEVATQLTSALIKAGHVPAYGKKGVDASAVHATDLFFTVLEKLSRTAKTSGSKD